MHLKEFNFTPAAVCCCIFYETWGRRGRREGRAGRGREEEAREERERERRVDVHNVVYVSEKDMGRLEEMQVTEIGLEENNLPSPPDIVLQHENDDLTTYQ